MVNLVVDIIARMAGQDEDEGKVSKKSFEDILKEIKSRNNIENDFELSEENLDDVISGYKNLVKDRTEEDFPQNVKEQLFMAISADKRQLDNAPVIV